MSQKHTFLVLFSSLAEATGPLPFNMTNDYLFKAVLQSNNHVLCELIRSLLHFPRNYEIIAEIQNPIILGQSIDILPVIHIGFLDFTLFKSSPRFYSTYKLTETETHQVYSDNFDLRVLDLTQIELATDEDKEWQLDYWATLFKAKTWEDLKAMANTNVFMDEACQTIFKMTADEWVQKCCYDREDYLADIESYKDLVAEKDAVIAEKDATIAEKEALIRELRQQLSNI